MTVRANRVRIPDGQRFPDDRHPNPSPDCPPANKYDLRRDMGLSVKCMLHQSVASSDSRGFNACQRRGRQRAQLRCRACFGDAYLTGALFEESVTNCSCVVEVQSLHINIRRSGLPEGGGELIAIFPVEYARLRYCAHRPRIVCPLRFGPETNETNLNLTRK